MARPPTPDVQITERIQPQAAPVDTYVRPEAPPQDNGLMGLARALQGLSSDLDGYLSKQGADQKTKDQAEASKAFYDNNRMGYAEGVRTGVIPANASKHFIDAWKEADGQHIGQQLQDNLTTAYTQWDGKDSTDPKVFDAWLSSNLSSMLKDANNDPSILKGLMPYIENATTNLHGQNLKDQANNIYNNSLKSHVAAATYGIENLTTDGTDQTEKVWQQVLSQREAALASGVKAEDFDKQLVDMVTAKATQAGDTDILKVLDRKLPGKEFAIKDDPQFRDATINAESNIMDLKLKVETHNAKVQEDADKAHLKSLKVGVMETLASDPLKPIPDEVLKEGTKLDPMFRTDMLDAQKKLVEGRGTVEDPQTIERIYKDVAEGGGTKTVLDAMRYGVVKNPETVTKLMTYAKGFDRESDSKVLKDPAYNRALGILRSKTTSFDQSLGFDNGAWSEDGMQAEREFTQSLLEWEAQNPNADAMTKQKAMNDILDGVLKGVTDTGMGTGTFTPKDQRISQPQQQVPQTQGQEQGATTPGEQPMQPTAPPVASKPPPADMPKYETLSPGFKSRLEEEARKRAIDPQQLYQRLYEMKLQKSPEMMPPGQQGSYQPDGSGTKADAVKQAAKALGVDPVDLATAISYETIGKFSPSIRGGKNNKYIGLIQFGPAEQKQYGAHQKQTFQQQMAAVVAYLKDRGVKPGMGLLDIYSTINAGSPGHYRASDGPGNTVAKHVAQMNKTHRQGALAFLNSKS